MKFARYLHDTQVAEWKRAYIDYRGLKVQLGIIRAQAPQSVDASSSVGTADVDHTHHSTSNNATRHDSAQEPHSDRGNSTSARIPRSYTSDSMMNATVNWSDHGTAPPIKRRSSGQERPSLTLAVASLPPRVVAAASGAPSQQTPLPPRTPRSPPVFPFLRDSGTPVPPPLRILLANLPATHTKFFDMLNAELEKVETFYAEREKEMQERAKRLREQLNELGIHRQIHHQSSTRSKTSSWTKSVPPALLPLVQWFQGITKPGDSQISASGIQASESARGGNDGVDGTSKLGTHAAEHKHRGGDQSRSQRLEGIPNTEAEKDSDSSSKSNAASSSRLLDDSAKSPPKRSNSLARLSFGIARNPLDPQEYQHAKRRLRRAVVEHYRGLEVLNNYRILNLTGFRKALKKYEKITHHSVLDAYMKEKVEPSAFASGAMVSTMLKEMEDLFAMRFERGDRKKALDRLRVGPLSKTHHFSTFRSGFWLGLAVPAIAAGIYQSFQDHTRGSLPSWNILLFIYSIFLVPVLLVLMIGLNIAVWARERINYVFIFALNPRSRLDHHEYFELPSFLLFTLAHAFWLSMSQTGPPLLWPLIWLALVLVVMFNPIRSAMWGRARWWTIKNVAKLGASGVWRVEFTDFWLGDQFCSLVYSLSQLFFVGCFYTHYFTFSPVSAPLRILPLLHASSSVNITSPLYSRELSAVSEDAFWRPLSAAYNPNVQDAWKTCGGAQNWEWYYLLSVLPFVVRFVQSLRRFRDSKLPTHLINAGKYGMGMIYYFFYYYWKHQGSPHIGASYIVWMFTAIAYAIYGCAWDFLMDWSLCKPHARYPLLRAELVYKSQIPSYYFAMAYNVCIRFIWLMYIPAQGPNYTLRAFIAAMLEMLRRVQWNFYRLENEHLGNMDQYRVTREVPLPYSFDVHSNEEEEEQEQEQEQEQERERSGETTTRGDNTRSLTWWTRRRMVRPRRNGGHG